MVSERKVIVTLLESDIQAVEQALLDEDAESALEFVREVLWPQMDKVLHRQHCKPTFEWGSDMDFRPSGPPDGT